MPKDADRSPIILPPRSEITGESEQNPALRGPPQHRFNGHRTSHIKGLKGNTFGPGGKMPDLRT